MSKSPFSVIVLHSSKIFSQHARSKDLSLSLISRRDFRSIFLCILWTTRLFSSTALFGRSTHLEMLLWRVAVSSSWSMVNRFCTFFCGPRMLLAAPTRMLLSSVRLLVLPTLSFPIISFVKHLKPEAIFRPLNFSHRMFGRGLLWFLQRFWLIGGKTLLV